MTMRWNVCRYIDMLLRRRGQQNGWKLRYEDERPRYKDAGQSAAQVEEIRGMLGAESSHMDSDSSPWDSSDSEEKSDPEAPDSDDLINTGTESQQLRQWNKILGN